MDDDSEEKYLIEVLKGKCKSFKVVDGRLTQYQITYKEWLINKHTRAILHNVIAKHSAMKK